MHPSNDNEVLFRKNNERDRRATWHPFACAEKKYKKDTKKGEAILREKPGRYVTIRTISAVPFGRRATLAISKNADCLTSDGDGDGDVDVDGVSVGVGVATNRPELEMCAFYLLLSTSLRDDRVCSVQ